MADYQTILYTVREGVATITLNRPDRRNAISRRLALELTDAMRDASVDAAVRAIVLGGAGAGFCAGADLVELQQVDSPGQVRTYLLEVYKPLMQSFVETRKPVVAAVNGIAAGAGASLALACDLRVMAEDAGLLMAFINIGLVPDAGATWFLARQVGYSRALELAIEGKPLFADRCFDLGLTNRVVPRAQLRDVAMEWAEELAAGPTVAIGLTKQAMHRALQSELLDAIDYEAGLQEVAVATADHAEGVAAFLQKRDPDFRGA